MLIKQSIKHLILSQPNRGVVIVDDLDLYKAQRLIENFFAKLKQYLAITTHYDKRAANFLGAAHLARAC